MMPCLDHPELEDSGLPAYAEHLQPVKLEDRDTLAFPDFEEPTEFPRYDESLEFAEYEETADTTESEGSIAFPSFDESLAVVDHDEPSIIMDSNDESSSPSNRSVEQLIRTPGRRPSPQPTHFNPGGKISNGNGHRVLRSATVGYIAPEFKGKKEQILQG